MKKRPLIALALLLLLTTFNSQKKFNLNSILKIEKIIIVNNFIVKKKYIKKKLSFLYDTNLFFLKTPNVEKQLIKISFIESFKIKKIYPNTIKITIFEKKPIVVLQNKQSKYYYTDKGDVINYINLKEFENLPIVFGDKENFKFFYDNLIKIKFPTNEITKFYLFESKRWDLITKKNQTIKLPIKNYNKSLLNFMNLKYQGNFEKFKIFDYRINEQLILK